LARPTEVHIRTIESALAGSEAARSPLVASWSRSARLHGLDPTKRRRPERMTEAELAEARLRMEPLVRAAEPTLDRLFQAVGGVGCCVLLADREGVPLERRGSPVDDPVFADWGLWPGTRWSEAEEGTNGIGTCLVEQRTVTIHRDQHFLAQNTILSCMSAPVFDSEGRLTGVLDVSSARADLSEGFATLIAHSVTEAARRIEAEAFRLAFPKARMVLVPGADRALGALLAVNEDDLVVGATRGARGLSASVGRSGRASAPCRRHPWPRRAGDAGRGGTRGADAGFGAGGVAMSRRRRGPWGSAGRPFTASSDHATCEMRRDLSHC
jgi:transcriptional regulator of acetoin/glycerol metabolism